MTGTIPSKVVETPAFLAATRKLMDKAKNDRADLSQQDRNDFRRLTACLVEAYKRKRT